MSDTERFISLADELATIHARWANAERRAIDFAQRGRNCHELDAAIPGYYDEVQAAWQAVLHAVDPKLGPDVLAAVYRGMGAFVSQWPELRAGLVCAEAAEPAAAEPAAAGPAAADLWLARAMLLVRDNPEWSDARIAREVGKSPSTLSRSREYRAAARLARQPRGGPRKGHLTVDSEHRRDVEVYDLDADPAERDWDD